MDTKLATRQIRLREWAGIIRDRRASDRLVSGSQRLLMGINLRKNLDSINQGKPSVPAFGLAFIFREDWSFTIYIKSVFGVLNSLESKIGFGWNNFIFAGENLTCIVLIPFFCIKAFGMLNISICYSKTMLGLLCEFTHNRPNEICNILRSS